MHFSCNHVFTDTMNKEHFLTALMMILAPPSAATAPAQQEAPPMAQFLRSPLTLMLLAIGVMWVLHVPRPGAPKIKKRQDMLKQMKKGDEIQTIGGIIGKVIEAREDRVLVKIDETANAKVWFTRNAIHRVILEEDKAEAK